MHPTFEIPAVGSVAVDSACNPGGAASTVIRRTVIGVVDKAQSQRRTLPTQKAWIALNVLRIGTVHPEIGKRRFAANLDVVCGGPFQRQATQRFIELWHLAMPVGRRGRLHPSRGIPVLHHDAATQPVGNRSGEACLVNLLFGLIFITCAHRAFKFLRRALGGDVDETGCGVPAKIGSLRPPQYFNPLDVKVAQLPGCLTLQTQPIHCQAHGLVEMSVDGCVAQASDRYLLADDGLLDVHVGHRMRQLFQLLRVVGFQLLGSHNRQRRRDIDERFLSLTGGNHNLLNCRRSAPFRTVGGQR